MTDAVAQAVASVVTNDVAPGCAAVVVAPDGRRVVCTSGRLFASEDAPPVDEDTAWDLASLTKLLSTTVVCADALDDGWLRLDEQPFPQWPAVTVEHVLRHQSGLPAWLPLYEQTRRATSTAPHVSGTHVAGTAGGREAVLHALRAVAPERPPGEATVYSDLGFIALGAHLEERAGVDLAALCRGAWHRRGLPDIGLSYVPLSTMGFHPAVPRVAPTERCPWRRRLVVGQVHDENAFALGGVAAHAGLFGSLVDVERAGRALAAELSRGGTLSRFAAVDGHARGVGFDRATPGGTTADALSSSAVGHLGFTGCSLWIDQGAVYVLLSNRICETRDRPEGIREARRAFHGAAAAFVRNVR